MKTKLYDLEQVFVAFYREELEENPGFILINYIPASTTHVRRGMYHVPPFSRTIEITARLSWVHSTGFSEFKTRWSHSQGGPQWDWCTT